MAEKSTRTDVEIVGRDPDTATDLSGPESRPESTVRTLVTGVADDWSPETSEPTRTVTTGGPSSSEEPVVTRKSPMKPLGDEPATKRVPMLDSAKPDPSRPKSMSRPGPAAPRRRGLSDSASWDKSDDFSDKEAPPPASQSQSDSEAPAPLAAQPVGALSPRERQVLLVTAAAGIGVMVLAYLAGRLG